jgi:hypothetical protein
MIPIRSAAAVLAATVALSAAAATPAAAQAWFYPSFQIPRTVDRDYTFGLIANDGAGAVFQWREGIGAGAQLSLDAGLADASGVTQLFVGGQYAYQLTGATSEQPLDVLLTAGLGLGVGDGPEVIRIPVGVSLGHRFPLEGGLAITPYVHPRLSLDVVTGTGGNRGSNHLTLDFDLGGSLEVTRQLAIRASVLVSGAELGNSAAFGLGLTFTPPPLRR